MEILLKRVSEAWDAFLDDTGELHISLIIDVVYFCTFFNSTVRPSVLSRLSSTQTANLNQVKPIINQAIFESKKSFNGFTLLK